MKLQIDSNSRGYLPDIVKNRRVYIRNASTGHIMEYKLSNEQVFEASKAISTGHIDDKIVPLPVGYNFYLEISMFEKYMVHKMITIPATVGVVSVIGFIIYKVIKK